MTNSNNWPARGSRSVCGTLNNPSEEEIEKIFNFEKADYVCGAIEYAPTTGTRHWQFYIHFRNCIRLSTLKTLNERAHWEVANGTALENKNYCLKEGEKYAHVDRTSNLETFKERGILPSSRIDGMLMILDDYVYTIESIAEKGGEIKREGCGILRDMLAECENNLNEIIDNLRIIEGSIDHLTSMDESKDVEGIFDMDMSEDDDEDDHYCESGCEEGCYKKRKHDEHDYCDDIDPNHPLYQKYYYTIQSRNLNYDTKLY